MPVDGFTKSAMLLLSLGEDQAAEVFKFLGPKEVQKLGETMAKVRTLTREELQPLYTEVREHARQQQGLGVDADSYLRTVLTKALGTELAKPILDRILRNSGLDGIEGLKWMAPPAIAELIRNEHPQIIATILVHIDRDVACSVLTHLTDRLRADTLLRISTLEGIQPAALRELNDVLAKLLHGGATDNLKQEPIGGIRAAAEIMNFMPAALGQKVIDAIKEHDDEMAQKIHDEMFVFENILDIDDRGIQALLREVASEALVLALKGASRELREKVFRNMSQRAAESLREDLDSRGPVKVAEVEAQQKEILKTVRRLAEDGQIQLGGKAEDAYL